ncbi:MAG: MgtC/SapB family protein [Clostridiales bacterium]|nr:MgtC/SapB family protein [Clostridiales bacterium]
MTQALASLREFSFLSAVFRLLLALIAGVLVGYGRSRTQRAAGLRTYTLIAVGSALSVMISLYLYEMLHGPWLPVVETVGQKFDATRYAAQTITGIGFLGAGIIFKIAHSQVSGLTTATGLFAVVCIGICAGSGFYEAVLIAILIVILVLNVMWPLERQFKRRMRNINLYVELYSIDDIAVISDLIESMNAQIFDIELERTERTEKGYPSAVFNIKMSKENRSHSAMLSSVAEMPCVQSVQELIS